jgi:hypothetical protein
LKKLVAQGEQVYLMSISQMKPDEPEPGKSKLGGTPEFRAKLETLLKRFEKVGPSDPELIPPLPPARRDVGHAIDIVPGSTPPNKSD